jgi:hypothetical protein
MGPKRAQRRACKVGMTPEGTPPRANRRVEVESLTAPPQGGGDSNFKPSSDVRRHQIPRISLANEGNRREPNLRRTNSLQHGCFYSGRIVGQPWAEFRPYKLSRHRGVRIRPSPPNSLRFEAFSGEVRKLRACSGDAHAPSAPESAHMPSRGASLRFSLCGRVIRCRCRKLDVPFASLAI